MKGLSEKGDLFAVLEYMKGIGKVGTVLIPYFGVAIIKGGGVVVFKVRVEAKHIPP